MRRFFEYALVFGLALAVMALFVIAGIGVEAKADSAFTISVEGK